MSASIGIKLGVMAAVISCFVAGLATAQETQLRDDNEAAEALQVADDDGARQADRAEAQQSERSETLLEQAAETEQRDRTGQAGQPGQAAQRHTAGYRGETDSAGGASQEVQKFLAACLLAKNKTEIQLSQLATEQAQNQQVKQFAQKMIQDHQQVVQKLQPLAGMQGDAGRGTGTARQQDRDTASLEIGTGDTDAVRGATRDRDQAQFQAGARTSANQGQQGGASKGTVHQLIQIDRQINDRFTQAAIDELRQKQGAEFDKAFLGMAIGAHTHMNAALETIQQQRQGQLAQIAQQAQPTVQQHLQQAKQLMQQLEGQQGAQQTERAQRESGRTQR